MRRYVEYLDTVWLVLKGKEVSLLQTFHHFGAPWDVFLGAYMPACVNAYIALARRVMCSSFSGYSRVRVRVRVRVGVRVRVRVRLSRAILGRALSFVARIHVGVELRATVRVRSTKVVRSYIH